MEKDTEDVCENMSIGKNLCDVTCQTVSDLVLVNHIKAPSIFV